MAGEKMKNKSLPFREFVELDASDIKLVFKFPLRETIEKDKLLFKFPIKEYVQKKDSSIKFPIKEYALELETVHRKVKVPLRESARGGIASLPVLETAWVLNGLIIEENVIELIKGGLTLIENVKNRILFNVELLGKAEVKLSWFGEQVDFVDIFDKYSIETDYPNLPIVTLPWDAGHYIYPVDDASHDIKIVCHDGYGESGVLTLGDVENIEIDVETQLPVNEKICLVEVDYLSTYRIEVNL